MGLPARSLAEPAATRIQPSLTQYSSTLVFSTPLKRTPTPRSSAAASWYGLFGFLAKRSGGTSSIGSPRQVRSGLQPPRSGASHPELNVKTALGLPPRRVPGQPAPG